MTRNDIRRFIVEREEAFARWHTKAMQFANAQPSQITDWSQLPPFPCDCTPGVPLRKTTVRIPQQWRENKSQYVMRLASFVVAHAYNLYEHNFLTAYAATPAPCVGIVKQCGPHVAIFWLEFEIDGGLVQVTVRHSVYESRIPLFQPVRTGSLREVLSRPNGLGELVNMTPQKQAGFRAAELEHAARVEVTARQYWPSWPLWRAIGMIILLSLGSFSILAVLRLCVTDFRNFSYSTIAVAIANIGIIYYFILKYGKNLKSQRLSDMRNCRDDYVWCLSVLYFPAVTGEDVQDLIRQSHDQQVFVARMGGVLQQLEMYAETQE